MTPEEQRHEEAKKLGKMFGINIPDSHKSVELFSNQTSAQILGRLKDAIAPTALQSIITNQPMLKSISITLVGLIEIFERQDKRVTDLEQELAEVKANQVQP